MRQRARETGQPQNFPTYEWAKAKLAYEPDPRWQCIVGNIGTVYDGTSEAEARDMFATYVTQSSTGYGRAAGEPVTLMRDDEIVAEHCGTQATD